ncbi:MAG: hypothetical protein IJF49_08580 [Clostridia bacterium]|nr:hypothetical protein [Clostridia bacterium]
MPKQKHPSAAPSLPPSVLLILILALVFALVIFGLAQLKPTGIADFLANLFGNDRDNPQENIAPEYALLLEQFADETAEAPIPVDALTLTEAFANFPFASHYTHQYTVSYTDGTRTSSHTISLTRSGEEYQILQYEGEQIDPNKLLFFARADASTFLLKDTLGNQHLYQLGEDFPFSSVAMLPDPEIFCEHLLAFEQRPTTSAYSACSAHIERHDAGRMLVLRFTEREGGGQEEYRYLLDYGILYSAVGTRGGEIYYTLDTLTFSTTQAAAAQDLSS